MSFPLLSEILEFSRDGEWGKGEPADGLVKMGVIRGTDFDKIRRGDLSTIPVRYIPKKAADRKTLRPRDILFETAGGTKDQPTGRSVFLKRELFDEYPYPLTCASFSRFLRVGKGPITPEYLFWYLQYLWSERLIYQYHIQHTGVARFQYTQFASEQTIPVLEPAHQDAISGLLGALDDKIELNRRMSATLEEMARALYRSWFVDFDPVHARALGQPPAHMDPTTAALFPDSFGPDGLPKGWEREPLAEHVRATRGLSYKGKHLCGSGDGVPLHNLNSIFEGGGYKDDGAKYYDGDFKERHEIRPGDLIVANTEQSFGLELIGHAALVPSWLGPSGIFSQHLYKVEIRPGSPLSKEWIYLGLSIAPLGVEIRGFSNGTTVNMLPADAFEIPETAIPPAAIVEKMNEIVRPAFAQQERLREESRTLAALRDTLLPRLMSGELRIREAEKKIEEFT